MTEISTTLPVCRIAGCTTPSRLTRGMCRNHYQHWRMRRLECPGAGERPHKPVLPLPDRFWSSVNKTESCWLWSGTVCKDGYGELSIGGKRTRAHRYSWQLRFGQIPDGIEIDHQCRVRSCVNPDHLRLATRKQNSENRPVFRNNTSGYRGVSWVKDSKKWKATVVHFGKSHYLGLFDSAAEAGAAAAAMRMKLFSHSQADY